jgi:hypothetical protein
MVLIDTSAWLFALRKDYHPKIKERIDNLLHTLIFLLQRPQFSAMPCSSTQILILTLLPDTVI